MPKVTITTTKTKDLLYRGPSEPFKLPSKSQPSPSGWEVLFREWWYSEERTCDQATSFIRNQIAKAKADGIKEELKFLKRMKLEFDVVVCDCGEEWKDTDGAMLIKERIKELKSKP